MVCASADPIWIMENLVERRDLMNAVIGLTDRCSAKVGKKIDLIKDLVDSESMKFVNPGF